MAEQNNIDQTEKSVVLDRTGQNLGDVESEENVLGPDLIEVHYTNTRLKELPPLHRLTSVEVLILRQNLLDAPQLTELGKLTTLKHLDLYGNQLTTAEIGIENCTNLEVLDVSFNNIKRMNGYSTLVNLKELYFANNKVRQITEGMKNLTQLEYLELGFNRIRQIKNLEFTTTLQHLWLGKNKITTIENLNTLVNLKRLDFQCNRITKLEGLSCLVNLEELYLSHNGLKKIEGLENLTKLQTLDLSSNFIEHIENIEHLSLLEEFWFNNNLVESFSEAELLTKLTNLKTVYLEGNPMANDKDYRKKMLDLLPHLEQLDALPTTEPTYRIIVRNDIPHELPPSLRLT